jgi:hypothetical protein
MADSDRRIVKSATESREGVTGHNVRYVLGVSLACIVVIFAGLWWYFFG